MGFSFYADEEDRILYTKVSGEPRGPELMAFYGGLMEFGYWETGWRELVDGRGIIRVQMTYHDQEALASFGYNHRHKLAQRRVAMVAGSVATYGVFRQYQLISEKHQPLLMVFDNLEPAARYLKVDLGKAEQRLAEARALGD